jgi:hypothetical protein
VWKRSVAEPLAHSPIQGRDDATPAPGAALRTVAALGAAAAGMTSCFEVFGWAGQVHASSKMGPEMDTIVGSLSLLLPLVAGAGMATLVYTGLTRMQPPRASGATVEPVDTRTKRSTGALAVCLMILGISGAVGAMLGKLFDNGQAEEFSSAFQGGEAGVLAGLFLALPTALILWLVGRRRR